MEYSPGINEPNQDHGANGFESDAHKIVRLHLQDKNHVITEDEIRSVRVGMTPPLNDADSHELREDAGDERASDSNGGPAGTPVTPWDAVEP